MASGLCVRCPTGGNTALPEDASGLMLCHTAIVLKIIGQVFPVHMLHYEEQCVFGVNHFDVMILG